MYRVAEFIVFVVVTWLSCLLIHLWFGNFWFVFDMHTVNSIFFDEFSSRILINVYGPMWWHTMHKKFSLKFKMRVMMNCGNFEIKFLHKTKCSYKLSYSEQRQCKSEWVTVFEFDTFSIHTV